MLVTINDLPPASTKRWTPMRKAVVVIAVHNGLVTITEACARYSLTIEEFFEWQRLYSNYGSLGLHVTRVQRYRKKERNNGK